MYIINKYIDWAFAGGLSLLVYAFVWFFDIDLFSYNIVFIAFLLANFINYPHFIASYGFLYIDERKKLFSNLYYIFVSTLLPLILVVVSLYAVITEKPSLIGFLIQIMFFIVGYHYVRQVYGIGLISLAKMKVFLSQNFKNALNYSLIPAWLIAYIHGSNTHISDYYGIKYITFGFHHFLKEVNTILFLVSAVIWVSIVIYIVYIYKKWPITFIIVFLSISLWHVPSFYNSGFMYIIPMFHSLQYLLIVAAVKKKQIGEEGKYKKYITYVVSLLFVAYMLFIFIPKNLDAHLSYNHEIFGFNLFLVLFLVFINIHHYFIDAIIWRKGSDVAKNV